MYLLGVDIGTTRVKVLVMSADGEMISSGYSTYELRSPGEGLVELNPEVWWNAFKETLSHVIKEASISPSEISTIGLSGQLNSITFLGSQGKPIRNSVIWVDSRGVDQAKKLGGWLDPIEYHRITGIRPSAFFTLFKLLWFRENEPETLARADKILQAKDYICFRLTGEYALDKSMASSAGILDLRKDDFAYEILEKLEIPVEKFPRLVSPVEVVGEVSPEAMKETGLPQGTPVIAGSGDVMMDALGSGTIEENRAYNKTATGSDVVVCSGKPVFDENLRTVTYRHVVGGRWLVIAGTGVGICYRWFRDSFCQLEKAIADLIGVEAYHLMDAQAEKAPPGSAGLIFLPYVTGIRSPLWDERAKGVFFGIKYEHDKRYFIRSVMEGIAFSARHRIDVIENDLKIPIKEIRIIGGGSRSRVWRRIMADIYKKTLLVPSISEPECVGAAVLGGVGAGIYRDLPAAISSIIKIEEEIKPDPQIMKVYNRLYEIYLTLYERVKDLY